MTFLELSSYFQEVLNFPRIRTWYSLSNFLENLQDNIQNKVLEKFVWNV